MLPSTPEGRNERYDTRAQASKRMARAVDDASADEFKVWGKLAIVVTELCLFRAMVMNSWCGHGQCVLAVLYRLFLLQITLFTGCTNNALCPLTHY